MDLRELEGLMNEAADKLIPRNPVGDAFRNAMIGRKYGFDETMDAWTWFCRGWSERSRWRGV